MLQTSLQKHDSDSIKLKKRDVITVIPNILQNDLEVIGNMAKFM